MNSFDVKEEPTGVDPLSELREAQRAFAAERDWDQFHSPKNLSMALSVEAAELLEHFQWLSDERSRELPPEMLREVRAEMADILLYLVRLADNLGVDLARAAKEKMQVNAQKYPVAKSRGKSGKYSEL